jgi:hypothetical protein
MANWKYYAGRMLSGVARPLMPVDYFRWAVQTMERERLAFLNKRARESHPDILEHTLQITSFGGCGTTMLYRFFSKHAAPTPPAVDDWYPWKHMLAPPDDENVKDGFRAIYVFADPLNSTLSVFRRDFQHELMRRMPPEMEDWNTSWDLRDFLEQKKDYFQFQNQYHNWTTADRDYPILLIKYEAIWDHLPELMTYVGLPQSAADAFPEKRPRSSSWNDEPDDVREPLQKLYGDLRDEVQAAPEFQVI